MDEVDRDAVDRSLEVGEGVDRAFGGAPIVVIAPIVNQFLEISGVGAVIPVVVGEVGGETRAVRTASSTWILKGSMGMGSYLGIGESAPSVARLAAKINRFAIG
jgi:hypothetical protein